MLWLVEEKLKDFDPKAPGFPFSRELFWDYPDLNIDLEKHARIVIERVVIKGRLEDFYKLLKIYSTQKIIHCLKRSTELDPKTRHFVSWYFNIPSNELQVAAPFGADWDQFYIEKRE
jgi:hypothetical protein